MGVDRARDGQIRPSCLVLVNDGGALAVVAIRIIRSLKLAPASCREVVAGVPEIVKVQASELDDDPADDLEARLAVFRVLDVSGQPGAGRRGLSDGR